MRPLRGLLVVAQLAVALPLLWWALFPRLGPAEWFNFIFFAPLAALLVSPVVAGLNAVWWVGRLQAGRPRRRLVAPALLLAVWSTIAVLNWSGIARLPLRGQLAESQRVVGAALHCTPLHAEWYEIGAEVYCDRPGADGEGERLRAFAVNGPFPWSPWRVSLDEREVMRAPVVTTLP